VSQEEQWQPKHRGIDRGQAIPRDLLHWGITSGLPEKKPSRPYILQAAPGETLPLLKEALVEVTLGRNALRIWLYVTKITDVFVLALRSASLRSGSGFEAPRVTTERRRRVIKTSRDMTTVISPYDGQQRGNAGSVWESSEARRMRRTA
jgi:hypothetical protein